MIIFQQERNEKMLGNVEVPCKRLGVLCLKLIFG